jgi:Tfp pilus assembly protein PilV
MKSTIDNERASYVRWPIASPIRNERRGTNRIALLLMIGVVLILVTGVTALHVNAKANTTRSPLFVIQAWLTYRGIEEMQLNVDGSVDVLNMLMKNAAFQFTVLNKLAHTPQESNTYDVLRRYLKAVDDVHTDLLRPYITPEAKLQRDLAQMAVAKHDACLVIPGR